MYKDKNTGPSDAEHAKFENARPAFKATIQWIEKILGTTFPTDQSYRSLFVTGEALCNLMNAIIPCSIRRINRCPNRASAMDNLTLFLSACEDKCGIPQSTLFSIDDFEDIFERRAEINPYEEKNLQRSEKVAISLFWLARFTDQEPECAHLPKLDYIAFSGILPRSLILNSLSGYSAESIASRFWIGRHHTEELPFNGTVERRSPIVIERQAQTQSPVPLLPQHMGNTDSTSTRLPELKVNTSSVEEPQAPQNPSSAPDNAGPVLRKANTLPAKTSSVPCQSSPSPNQSNNNGLEDDAWQDDLDAWRERRRRASRMQATKMTSLEEVREAEEKKKQEAIRDRMRQIKSQRSLASSFYIPTTDRIQPVSPSSPGMALLTGSAGLNIFEMSEDCFAANDENPEENRTAFTKELLPKRAELNGSSPAVEETNFEPTFELEAVDVKQVACEPETRQMDDGYSDGQLENIANISTVIDNAHQIKCISPDQPTVPVFSPSDYKELNIRVRSVMKASEPRWGMLLRAEGPRETAPFIVDRVKIGSAADICDVSKGDVLVQVNNTILNSGTTTPAGAITLSTLEQLLDQLSLENGSVNLRLLRKFSQTDDLSDVDGDDEQPAEHRVKSISSDVDTLQEESSFQRVHNGTNGTGKSHFPSDHGQFEAHTFSPSTRNHMSPVSLYENGSSAPSENRTVEIPLRNSLSTQIVDLSEVGATSLYSSSRAEPSTRSIYVGTSYPPELTQAEPQYLSLATSSVIDEQPNRTITVAQTFFDKPTIEAVPWKQIEDTRCSSLSDVSQLDSTTLHISPLPPPPAPLLTQSTIDVSGTKLPFYTGLQSTSLPKIDSDCLPRIANHTGSTNQRSSVLDSSKLPSPPSPTFLVEFTEPISKIPASQSHGVQLSSSYARRRTSETIFDRSSLLGSDQIKVKHGGEYFHRSSDTLVPKLSQEQKNTNPIPPPAVSLPMKTRPTAPEDLPLRSPVGERKHPVNTVEDINLNVQEMSPRRSFPPPPPPASYNTDVPPPPPRVPLNRCIDPKSKCTACTQELGTGDLMIIGSMNLCYHLACFVCSWCGVPLSDGRSNADVRIRMGQLYCQPCYPSKHGHRTVPQGDSSRRMIRDRAGTLPTRSSTPITCTDRRVRSRGGSSHSRRSHPVTGSKPAYF